MRVPWGSRTAFQGWWIGAVMRSGLVVVVRRSAGLRGLVLGRDIVVVCGTGWMATLMNGRGMVKVQDPVRPEQER